MAALSLYPPFTFRTSFFGFIKLPSSFLFLLLVNFGLHFFSGSNLVLSNCVRYGIVEPELMFGARGMAESVAEMHERLEGELRGRLAAHRESRLYRLYPDEGPLRRELYPKHLMHFRAGNELDLDGQRFNERALTGGNRCMTLATAIETDRGERRIGEMLGEEDFGVRSWVDGRRQPARATAVFEKGLEAAYLVLLDNGLSFECSFMHRVLTVFGWTTFGALIGWRNLAAVNLGALALIEDHVGLAGGQKIVSVVGLGNQMIVDFEVPGPHNYMAGGVIHHNSGKTLCCSYEVSLHLLGFYPPWWSGFRFTRPVTAWAAGEDTKAVRESLQVTYLGVDTDFGTGLIPKKDLLRITPRAGVPGAVDSFQVKSRWGGVSRLLLKCFVAGTRVRLASGEWRDIEWLRLGDVVRCADGSAHPVIATHSYASAPVIQVRMRMGVLTMSRNHEMFLVGGKKVRAEDLQVGDVVESVDGFCGDPEPQEDWRVKLTALMIGDGCSRGKTPFFTCNEPAIVDEVRAALPAGYRVVPINNTISFKISGSEHKFNILKHSLEADGLWGRKAKGKFIPGWVFRLGIEQKRTFLRWLWGCDGGIKEDAATYTSASRALMEDVRLLLLDFGIWSDIKTHNVRLKDKVFESHYVTLTGEARRLFQDIGKLNRDVAYTVKKPRPKGPPGEILSIADAGAADVFCITVEEAHEFIAEGFRSGNSYDQGRESFQAAKIDIMQFDEEPPADIYSEGLVRTMSTVPGEPNGLVICGFTPLRGLSTVVLSYMPGGKPVEGAVRTL